MKFSRPTNWIGNFNQDGLLYFAQRIEEMLYSYTDTLYSVPALNTHLLVLEYLETDESIENRTIAETQLKHIVDEFQGSFKSDVVIQDNLTEEECKNILDKLNTSNSTNQKKIMLYLWEFLKDYNNWCVAYIKKIVPQENEKKKIEKALRCFIPELIGRGYSGEYIYYYVKEVFFKTPVSSMESLRIFLERFDFKKKNYTVYVPVKKSVLAFKEILERRFDAEFGVFSEALDLRYKNGRYVLVKLTLKDYDERAVAEQAYNKLNFFFKYYNFLGNEKQGWINNKCKVIDDQGKFAFVEMKPLCFRHYLAEKDVITTGQVTERVISMLLFNSKEAIYYIDRAVVMHNTAISEKNLSNGFLNLWSALEVLFVESQSKSKLNDVEEKVIPILQKNYIPNIFEQLEDYLKDNLGEEYIAVLKKEVSEYDDSTWLAEILALPQYEELRTRIVNDLKSYPVLRSRIMQISDMFKTKKSVLKEIDRYTSRIDWHLRRLYRTRNAIIHSGDEPTNIKLLGEHLHNYLDCCLYEIVLKLPSRRNIDAVLMDIVLSTDLIVKKLKGHEDVDKDCIKILMEK